MGIDPKGEMVYHNEGNYYGYISGFEVVYMKKSNNILNLWGLFGSSFSIIEQKEIPKEQRDKINEVLKATVNYSVCLSEEDGLYIYKEGDEPELLYYKTENYTYYYTGGDEIENKALDALKRNAESYYKNTGSNDFMEKTDKDRVGIGSAASGGEGPKRGYVIIRDPITNEGL